MKQVLLKSLSLSNFKGEKERTTLFNSDSTNIMGGNGLGKSRHFDAFIWLLFGKDTLDRKDYEVKTRVNKEILHKVECSVTGVLVVDGEEITLKRALIENWVKPHGQIEQVYKGDKTECWWNETPVSVTEYGKRVASIIEESVFKMITNPSFFVNMKWQLQREQLFQLAGTVSDAEIASRSPEFAALLEKISGKSFADFKAEISAKKKRLNEELKQIQPRIDQTHKMMPESEDFAALEADLAKVDEGIADIDNQLSDITTAMKKQFEAEQAKQNKVNAIALECQQIVLKAKENETNRVFEANARHRELEGEVKMLEREMERTHQELMDAQVMIARNHRVIDDAKAEQDKLREEWFAENEKEHNGETTCPHCGQALPETMVEKAKEIFIQAKQTKLGEISGKGKELGEKVAHHEQRVEQLQTEVEKAKEVHNNLKEQVEVKKAELATIVTTKVEEINPETLPEWVAKQKEIEAIKATISTDNSQVDTSGLKNQKSELNNQRNEIVKRLANRDVIEKCRKEVESLEEHGKELSQAIADIEREEYTVEQFTKKKIEECEQRVNAIFKHVSFQLFKYTLDNNPVEVCIPYANGVPYGTANTASQVNAGLDIINALCKFYGITAPIFIDNRESVNQLIETDSQIINLIVTQDKELIIK